MKSRMSTSTDVPPASQPSPASPTSSEVRRWLLVAATVALWWALYSLNRPFWDWLLFDVVGLEGESRLGESIHFFFYDVTKITLLLAGIIFVVTVLRSFMSVERTRALLGGRREGVGNVAAAGLGVVTPFCSCSAVPAFIGFVAAGVPLGVTMSFLIATPMVNEVAIVMLYGLFGWRITAIYIATGLVIATTAGWVIGRMGMERWVEPFVFETKLRGKVIDPSMGLSWDDRLAMGREEVASILRKIWPYLLVGIGLGAVLHGWVPANWFVGIRTPWTLSSERIWKKSHRVGGILFVITGLGILLLSLLGLNSETAMFALIVPMVLFVAFIYPFSLFLREKRAHKEKP